jgi:hypothetical protein
MSCFYNQHRRLESRASARPNIFRFSARVHCSRLRPMIFPLLARRFSLFALCFLAVAGRKLQRGWQMRRRVCMYARYMVDDRILPRPPPEQVQENVV